MGHKHNILLFILENKNWNELMNYKIFGVRDTYDPGMRRQALASEAGSSRPMTLVTWRVLQMKARRALQFVAHAYDAKLRQQAEMNILHTATLCSRACRLCCLCSRKIIKIVRSLQYGGNVIMVTW